MQRRLGLGVVAILLLPFGVLLWEMIGGLAEGVDLLRSTPTSSHLFLPRLLILAIVIGIPLLLILSGLWFQRLRPKPAATPQTMIRTRPRVEFRLRSLIRFAPILIIAGMSFGASPTTAWIILVAGIAYAGYNLAMLVRERVFHRDALIIDDGGVQYRGGIMDVVIPWSDIVTLRHENGSRSTDLELLHPLSSYGRPGLIQRGRLPLLMILSNDQTEAQETINAALRHHLALRPPPAPQPIMAVTRSANPSRIGMTIALPIMLGMTGCAGFILYQWLILGRPHENEFTTLGGILLCVATALVMAPAIRPQAGAGDALATARQAALDVRLAEATPIEMFDKPLKRLPIGLGIFGGGLMILGTALAQGEGDDQTHKIFIAGGVILFGFAVAILPLIRRTAVIAMDKDGLILPRRIAWADILAIRDCPWHASDLVLDLNRPVDDGRPSTELRLGLGGLTLTPAEIRHALARLKAGSAMPNARAQ